MAGGGASYIPLRSYKKKAYLMRGGGRELGRPRPPPPLALCGLAAHVGLANSCSTCHHAKLWRTDRQPGCPLTNMTVATGWIRRPPGEVSAAQSCPEPEFVPCGPSLS